MIHPQEIIGKLVKERYGRFTGTVVAYESNLLGEVTAIIYENNGLLIRVDSSSFDYNGKEIEVAPSSIIESKKLYRELSVLLIRLQSLFKLKNDNLMSEKSFQKIKNELNSIYSALNDKAVNLLEKLGHREDSLSQRKEWMYSLFMNLEISKRLNWISDDLYFKSYEQLEKELFRISSEIDDIKRIKIDLESVLNALRNLIVEEKVEVEELNQGSEEVEEKSSSEEIDVEKANVEKVVEKSPH